MFMYRDVFLHVLFKIFMCWLTVKNMNPKLQIFREMFWIKYLTNSTIIKQNPAITIKLIIDLRAILIRDWIGLKLWRIFTKLLKYSFLLNSIKWIIGPWLSEFKFTCLSENFNEFHIEKDFFSWGCLIYRKRFTAILN